MPFLAAAIWSISAMFGLELLVLLTAQLRSADHIDLVSGVLCEAAAFVGTLFLVVRTHERDRTLSDALALRPAPVSLCLLAAAIGVVSQAPFDLMRELIERRFPASPGDLALQAEVFAAPTLPRKAALVLAAGIVGPLVEELFFRGALYRGVRRSHGTAMSIVGVALFFAAVHFGSFAAPLFLVPVFLVGLMLGHARAASGSLWPAVVLHASFNSTSALASVTGEAASPFSVFSSTRLTLVGFATTLALVALYHLIASRSAACREARERDLV